MDNLTSYYKDVKCTSGTDFNFTSASLTTPPSAEVIATTPFTPFLYVTINTKTMKNPKILFKFSGILSHSITSSDPLAKGILLANTYIRISRQIDNTLIPVSPNFANSMQLTSLTTTTNIPRNDSSSLIFNFCHSPKECSCRNITYVIEVSSILTIRPRPLDDGTSITITGQLYNTELLTIAYDCE